MIRSIVGYGGADSVKLGVPIQAPVRAPRGGRRKGRKEADGEEGKGEIRA